MQLAIENEPDQTAAAIRSFLAGNDDYLDADPKPLTHPLAGHCYVASEAYYHLNDGQENWTPQHIEVEWSHGTTICRTPHWFLQSRHGERVVDLTAEQFAERGIEINYESARGRGFVPPTPSNRAKEVIEAIE
jgi:predicted N-acyltransferase